MFTLLLPNPLHAAVSWTNSGPGFFFVATNGNDQWSGSRPTANFGKTDGPFDHLSFLFMRNIVYFDSGRLIAGNWPAQQFRIDSNLYFDARPGATPDGLMFQEATLQQWRTRGYDLNSLVADPLFIAPRKYDFHLWSSSPAFKIGFHPVDVSQVGIRP